MKILCVFGEYNYGDIKRGNSYEFSNFLPGLRKLGHEVSFFDSLGRDNFSNFIELNQALINRVNNENPDIIFFSLMWYEIWVETIELLKKYCDVVTINWATDDSWKYNEFTRLNARYFDMVASTYDKVKILSEKDGIDNIKLTQWAANPYELTSPLPANKCKYDVTFVGSAYGKRPAVIEKLKKYGINVECFGYGWPNGPVDAEDISKIVRESIISLNFADSSIRIKGIIPTRVQQIKARTFEVPGAGGFLLTENVEYLDKYYLPGKEIEVYKNFDELIEKIKYYIENLEIRDQIAQAGYERTKAEHTYDKRFEEILDSFFKEHSLSNKQLEKNMSQCNKAIIELVEIAKEHKCSKIDILFKTISVYTFSLFLGSQRGARAVRRLVFEIYWRMCGVKTYRASGLPGRCFYKES